MNQPDLDVATVIASAGVGVILGVSLFLGKVREVSDAIPSRAVFCLTHGGRTPINYIDAAISPQLREPMVQIRVRSHAQDFAGGQALARSVKDAVHDKPPTGYYACRIEQAEPWYLGETQAGEHEFTMDAHLYYEE